MPASVRALLILALILAAGFLAYQIWNRSDALPNGPTGTASTTVITTRTGGITFAYPDSYGLAVRPEQVLVTSYIPPCDSGDPGFDYCLYRLGTEYAGTNFESAGLRIKERKDLSAKSACLSTLPAGYSDLVPRMGVGSGYAASVFSPLGDAAAGHYSSGALYRLHYDSTCYEFQTRIGESQFTNFPKGSVREFRSADRAQVETELDELLAMITIASTTESVRFPPR